MTGLQSCTTYHFAIRAADDNTNWSLFHGEVSVQTTCGGGGGGGSSAHQVVGDGEGGGGAVPAGAAAVGSAALEPGAGVLIAETRKAPDGSWSVTVRQAGEADGVAPADADAIVVQVRDGAGGWRTLSRYRPGLAESPLGLCARRDQGRVIFPAGYQLESVTAGIKAGVENYALLDADHSRLGDLAPALVGNRGSVEMAMGDSLTLVYQATANATPGATGWYLLVRPGTGSSTPSARKRPGLEIPRQFALHGNQPNPFRGTTTIPFDLPVAIPVRLELFDLLGRRVATVVNAGYPAGFHSVEWDLRDLNGGRARPGVYIYRMTAGDFRAKRKLSVLP